MEMSDLTTNLLTPEDNSQIHITSCDSNTTERTPNGLGSAKIRPVSNKNTGSSKIEPMITTATSTWKWARQKKNNDQNLGKRTIILPKEKRNFTPKLCNKDKLTECKDRVKDFETIENAIKTKQISEEHLKSLMSIATKGLLVRSGDRFDLKAQAVSYTQQSLILHGPSLTDTQCEMEFLSMTEMQRWDDTVRSFGLNIDVSAHTNIFAFDSPHSMSEETNISTDKEETKLNIAKAKYAFVPIKSFVLHHSNMRFDATVMRDIQEIGELIHKCGKESEMVDGTCRDFLHRYGSHVSTGNHDVGGIFKMYTVCNDFETTSKTNFSQMFNRQHTMYVEMMMPFVSVQGETNYSNGKGNQTVTTNHTNNLTIQNSFSRFGGPLNTDNFKKWKEGLLQDPETWTVIHRSDITGIWNILLNHKSDIAHWADVGESLQRNWEKIWVNSSKIETVDKILIHNIESIFVGLDLTETCTKETVEQLLNKCIRIAAGNKRFEKYTKGFTKWIQFLEKAISINEKLTLESRFCIKILLKITGEITFNLQESMTKFFYAPLFSCNERLQRSVVENIKSFIQTDFLQAYTSVGEIDFDPSWKCQVDEQAAMEIGITINHYGKEMVNVTECIYLAELAIKLPFNFKDLKFEKQSTQERSTVETNKTVANFFSSISQLKEDDTSVPGIDRLPQSVDEFVRLIEHDYFPKKEISANIFRRVAHKQFEEIVFCRMAALCKNMLETSYQVKKEFVKLALASVLWSDILKNKSMQLEEFKTIFIAGKNIWCPNTETECLQDLSCSGFITFVPGFISTIETYEKKDAKFGQIGVEFCIELFDRFNELLFENELDDQKQKNCIRFAFILAKARQALSIKNIFAIETFDDVKQILKEMEKCISEESQANNIPATEKDFVTEVNAYFIPIWRVMEDRLQEHNKKQKVAERIRDYFVVELRDLCKKSCSRSTEVKKNDIRKQLDKFLSKSPSSISSWKDLDRQVKVITSCPRIFVLSVESYFQDFCEWVRHMVIGFCPCCFKDHRD